jgi:hypothetical protein
MVISKVTGTGGNGTGGGVGTSSKVVDAVSRLTGGFKNARGGGGAGISKEGRVVRVE